MSPLYATADGGAIVTCTTQCPTNIVLSFPCTPVLGTLYTIDQNGNVTSQTADTGSSPSWIGWGWDAAVLLSETVSESTGASPSWGVSYGTNRNGNPSLDAGLYAVSRI